MVRGSWFWRGDLCVLAVIWNVRIVIVHVHEEIRVPDTGLFEVLVWD